MNKDKIAQEDKWAESKSSITSAQRRKNTILVSSYYKNSHQLLIERSANI